MYHIPVLAGKFKLYVFYVSHLFFISFLLCLLLDLLSIVLCFHFISTISCMYLSFFFLKRTLFLFIYLFIFGCIGSFLLRRLSLVAVRGGYSL